jgi:exonuclease III
MNTNIISWNVRGLNDGAKRLCVCNLLHLWKVDIVCLQETKVAEVNQAFINSLWRCRHVDWVCHNSIGASGGIILMWNTRVVEKLEEAVGMFSISCKFREVVSGFIWAFSGVYGSNRGEERRLLWEELGGLNAWWDLPWCVGGDFNTVHYPSERAGTTNISPGMNDFSDFIFHSGLIDLPLEDGSFTWSNSLSKSRLDRFLFSPSLEDHFSRIV